jgi:SRSO17 transposase
MDIEQAKQLRRELDVFVSLFSDCIKTEPSRRHFRTYVAGQVSNLERKNVAAIALDVGVPPRSLQEFLGIHLWDELGARDRVQERVMGRHADPNGTGVIDETSFPKKGDKTAGVQRQYCGATGKTDNCVVTVHLGYVTEDFHALLDADLYLPEAWLADRERCREAGIPDSVVYRPKWRIALDLLDHALGKGVRLKWVTADEEYGRCTAFRTQVGAWGLFYVVEVPCSQTGWTRRPRVVEPRERRSPRRGRPPRKPRLAWNAPPARRVDALWKRGGPSWGLFHIKNTEKGPVVWEARLSRFFPWDEELPGEECWLIVARNVLDGKVKYFLSNAPRDTPAEVLLHVAFNRCHVERLFQDSKGEVGLDHFEVRHYRALRRHLVLSMVSLLFLEEQTQRIRGEKSVVEPLRGSRGRRSTTRPADRPEREDTPPPRGFPQDRILAAGKATGGPLPLETAPKGTQTTRHQAVPSQKVLQCFLAL